MYQQPFFRVSINFKMSSNHFFDYLIILLIIQFIINIVIDYLPS